MPLSRWRWGPSVDAQPAPHIKHPRSLPKTRPKNRSLAIFHSVFVQMVFVTAPPERRGQNNDRYADFWTETAGFAPLNNMNNSSIFEQ